MTDELSQCPFIVKLWQMLADEANFEVLAWDEYGESFHVLGSVSAISKMLSRYFRHNKYSSFQRQLNYFGFQKIKVTDGTVIYHHKYFCLDRPDDVPKIKRKTNTGAREKQQRKKALGKRKQAPPASSANDLTSIGSAYPQPRRVRSKPCISPAQQLASARTISSPHSLSARTISSPHSLSDITNRGSKNRNISSRRSSRLADLGDSTDDEEEEQEEEAQGKEQGEEQGGGAREDEPTSPLPEFEETKFSWDGKPLDKLYPQLFTDDLNAVFMDIQGETLDYEAVDSILAT